MMCANPAVAGEGGSLINNIKYIYIYNKFTYLKT